MNTEQQLLDWVRSHLAQLLGVTPESIDCGKGLSNYGLDSVDAILMAGELEEAFSVEVDLPSFMLSESFEAVVATLAAQLDQSSKAAANS